MTRGAEPRQRPTSLLRHVAETAGVEIEPNGFYVPPNDPGALRRAIEYLARPTRERARLGAAGPQHRRATGRPRPLRRAPARLVDAAIAQNGRQPVATAGSAPAATAGI